MTYALFVECFIIYYLVPWALIIKFNKTKSKCLIASKAVLTTSFLFLLTNLVLAQSNPTAAETDWQPIENLADDALPAFCRGRYKNPFLEQRPDEALNGTADNAVYIEGKSTTLTGNVILGGKNREIRSPRVVQNEETQIAEIDGPLSIREEGLLITGEHASANIFDGSGVIDAATFLLHQSSFRGKAAQLSRDAGGHLYLDDASLTRCDPISNTWSMDAKDIELIPELGYGTARDVTIRIRDIPVLYTPYLRFPLDDKRLSGFLLPGLGHDSDGGTDIEIPYYFNLTPYMDATYTLRSLWKRGLIHDGQFRLLTPGSINEINAGFILKDDVYDDRNIEDLTSVGTNTAGVIFPDFEKQNRWLLNIRHQGGWNSNWKTSINYSAVSDIDYLHDIGGNVGSTLRRSSTGINSNLSNRRTPALDQIGRIKYRGQKWNAELLLREYQNLDLQQAEQYQQLPSLSADWSQKLGPVKLKANFNFTHFDKNTDNVTGVLATTGQRTVGEISASWPIQFAWGFLKPTIALINRNYNLNDVVTGSRTNPRLSTTRFSIDSGLVFDRFFKWGDSKIQQTLEPRLYMLYVENDEQDDLPQFDASATILRYSSLFRYNRYVGYDRIGDARQFSLGITSRLLNENTGAEFFSASIGQIYYLKDRQVIFRPTPADDPTTSYSAIFTRARLSLNPKLSISGSFEWEPEENRTNRTTFSLKYRERQGKILNVNYIYTASELRTPNLLNRSEESDVSFIWPLANKWGLIGRWNFGWDDNRTIESFVGLEFNDCCWKSRLLVRRFLKEPRSVTSIVDDPNSPGNFLAVTNVETPADVGIFFEFQLKGLATLGKRIDSLLEDAIPGYRIRENLIGL